MHKVVGQGPNGKYIYVNNERKEIYPKNSDFNFDELEMKIRGKIYGQLNRIISKSRISFSNCKDCKYFSEYFGDYSESVSCKFRKENKLKTVESDFVDFCKSNKEKFDQVVFIKVLHHFSSLKDIEYALLGAVEHCQKGSRVVIFEPNGTNPFWRFFLSFQKGMSGRSKWFYEQNMKFTTVKNLSNILDIIKLASNRKIRYKIGYHYVIPAMITKKHKRHSLLDKINNLLESSWLKKWFSFNISIIIDIE